jgi:ABC-type bacteriocin/lantibiotic exporter with double-glycine peptidase domain
MGARVAGLQDIETFKASGAEDLLFSRWLGAVQCGRERKPPRCRPVRLDRAAPALIGGLTATLVLVGGGLAVMAGDLTVGELVAFRLCPQALPLRSPRAPDWGPSCSRSGAQPGRLDDVLNQ